MRANLIKDQGTEFTVSHRSVLGIAVPMTLAYVSTPLVGLADTFAIGQLGDAALIGAIAIGAIIFDILFTTMNFLRTGTTGLVAQAFGAGDQKEQAAVFLRAVVLALGIGFAAIVLQTPLLEASLWFIGGRDRVQEAVTVYFAIRIFAAPLTLTNYAILGYFLGRGEAMTGLLIQTVLNLTNVALNLWFVLGLGSGIEGVALATILAEAVAVAFAGAIITARLRRVPLPSRADVFDRAALLRMLGVNRDIMIRSFALLFAFATFTRLSAQQGEVVLAANAILERYFLLAGYFLDGVAVAAEQLVGRALGAKRRALLVRSIRLCAIWSFALSSVAALFFFTLGGPLLDVMTTSDEVRAVGHQFLIFAALTPLVGAAAFLMDGVYIGATWSREMRNMMLLSLALYLVAAYTLTPLIGNTGLWLSFLLFLGIRGVTLGAILPHRIARTFADPD
ncbi:MAG: MATE family efflux transporter [Devosiaceae bacterium]|nr:MATE family efflux transporter [Devosiaceae bacterium MH13]